MSERKRVAVLISGRGSNMEALIAAAEAPDYPARICGVFANRSDAKGLDTAASRGIATAFVDHRRFADRQAFDTAIHEKLTGWGAELVACAGFMRIFSEQFVDAWLGRMINIHPALSPLFPGLDTHRRALEAGVKIHGCTVHFVTTGVDEGPIIAQAAVPVLAGDDPDRLAARVLKAEHRLYPRALALVACGKAVLTPDGVRLAEPLYDENAWLGPLT